MGKLKSDVLKYKKRHHIVRERERKMDDKLIQQILGIVIPKEILEDFEIERIEESEEGRGFHMVEKENRRPEVGEELTKNGFMRPKDIMHYPAGSLTAYCLHTLKPYAPIRCGHILLYIYARSGKGALAQQS